MIPITELPELEVDVTNVVFMPTLDAPADKPYPFVYFITVRNNANFPVTLLGRKWIVKGSDGETLVVQGDGVVGQTPRLEPGESFAYNSYHTIGVDSEATGAFFGEADNGDLYCARIPVFAMKVPLSGGKKTL